MTGMTRQGAANNRHTSGDHANSHATGAIDRHTGPADIDSRLSAGRQKQLERTIEGEIIPRLMLVHKQVKTDVGPRDSAAVSCSGPDAARPRNPAHAERMSACLIGRVR